MRSFARHPFLSLAVLAAIATPSFAETSLIEQGRAAIIRGDEDAAIEILEKAVAQSPKDADAHFNLANAYGSGEESLKKYLGHSPKANEPTMARAHYFLGSIYEKQGKKAEAKQSYEAALKLNSSLKDAREALKRVS